MIKRILIWSLAAILTLTFLVVAYAGITYWRASSGLPEWNGTLTAEGLDGPVEIIRDEHGIPYIEATTERDLYFAQGFVHAQDRFWQMALLRQRSQGRLAEWFGAPALSSDRNARYWNWNGAAQKSWESFPEKERPLLEAYADGINAWLNGPAYQRPPEMKILHIHPEPWRPQDSFLIVHQLYAPRIFRGTELNRWALSVLDRDSVAVDMLLGRGTMEPRPIIDSDALPQATAVDDETSASNSWVLSGDHTASGKPLMANDPHVPPTLPTTWQLQQLAWADGASAGITMPGVPGIVGGHNGQIAWTITAAAVDGADLALVERDPEDSSLYRHGPDDALKKFTTRVDTIQIRFGGQHVDTFRTTTRGRVGLPPSLNRFDVEPDGAQFLELRDVSFDYRDGLVLSSLRMAHARSTEQGLRVGALVTYPTISFSIADTSGNIGYQTAARIAIRPESHARFVDFAPADDNDRTYLQVQENPRIFNPPSGRIVTANQLIIGKNFPHYLSDGFASPTRAHRIDEVLDGTKAHDVASFVAMQNDAVSPVARELLPLMLKVSPADPADQQLLELLTNWDYKFDPDSVAPTIFTTWLSFLNQKITEDDFPGFNTVGDWSVAQRALGGERSDWCDDRRTEPVESCKQLLSSSLTKSREALEAELGTDIAGWVFGDVVPTRLPHMGFDRLPGLGGLFSREVAVPGGFASLFFARHTGRNAPWGISTISHSSYQGVYDLADLAGGSRYITPGGVSGHFKSPYYDNLTELWVRGERITLNPEEIEEHYRLILQPGTDKK